MLPTRRSFASTVPVKRATLRDPMAFRGQCEADAGGRCHVARAGGEHED
jgi:hypothetical protein